MSTQPMSFPQSTVKADVFSPINSASPIREVLSGEKAFYNQADYVEATKNDFASRQTLPATYTWNTESKILRVAKQVLSIIIFPIGIYQLIHSLAGKIAIVPAATPMLLGLSKDHADQNRLQINLNSQWKYKRITVEVDDYKVDAVIVGKASTLGNGRWVLASNGNGEFYEDKLLNGQDFKQILSETHGNAIVFNYPGVGSSTGMPSRQAMSKAYRAILSLLEDKDQGIGAREIIGYGHSLGGGVQGDALLTHELKKDINYVFVKRNTFGNLSSLISSIFNRFLGFLSMIFGWNMGSIESSKKLQVPEIIIQTAKVNYYEELTDSSKLIDDGVITAATSLAKTLLDDKDCPKENKLFIGMKEDHCGELNDPSYFAKKIENYLSG